MMYLVFKTKSKTMMVLTSQVVLGVVVNVFSDLRILICKEAHFHVAKFCSTCPATVSTMSRNTASVAAPVLSWRRSSR